MLLQEYTAQAHALWLAAAAVPGAQQAAAFAKLGTWYRQVKGDLPRARKCFQRGLGLSPLQAEAGVLTVTPIHLQPRLLVLRCELY